MAKAPMTAAEATAANASAAHDTPGNETRLSYLLLSQARTGSTMLEERLRARGLGMPFEYLNPQLMELLSERWAGRREIPFARYLDLLKQNRTAPGGTFGFKALATQLERQFPNAAAARNFIVGFDRIVVLCRRDKLAQAISAIRAEQTGQWTAALAPTGREPKYDAVAIARRVYGFLAQERAIDALRIEKDRPLLRIRYEDMRDDPEGRWAEVQKFLGVEPAPAGTAQPSVRPQRDALSEEWERRFLAHIRGEG